MSVHEKTPSSEVGRRYRYVGQVRTWLESGAEDMDWKCSFCLHRARSFEELRRHTERAHEGKR